MVLVDIGNTLLHAARCSGVFLRDCARISTAQVTHKTVEDIVARSFKPFKKSLCALSQSHLRARSGLSLCEHHLGNAYNKNMRESARDAFDGVYICSVVPRVTDMFEACKKKFPGRIQIVGRDIRVPIASAYAKKQIGQDRLVAAYAAHAQYPGSRIIIDFGTAITMDFLSARGGYLGGLILPGVGSSLRALSQCALLSQKFSLVSARSATMSIPVTTRESVRRGLHEGFSCMINELVRNYQKKLRLSSASPVVVTGGDAVYFRSFFTFFYRYDRMLIFKGLRLVARTRGVKGEAL